MEHRFSVKRLTAGKWRCDVCLRDRRYEEIEVAHHSSTNAQGVTVEHNVNYCADNPMCRRAALLRNHTELALRRLQAKYDDSLERIADLERTRTMWVRAAIVMAFIVGYIIGKGLL